MRRVYVIILMASWSFGSIASAQTWENRNARTVVLPGGGTDVAHTISIQAPALSSSFILTLPASNVAGILANDGSGGLTWTTSLASLIVPGGTNTFMVTNGSGTVGFVGLNTDATLTGNGIGSTLGLDLTHANIWTADQTIRKSAIGSTYTDGLTIANTTAATLLAPVQQSPNISLKSNVWNATSLASNSFDGRFAFVPSSGATPNARFSWATNNNGAGYTERMSLTDGGVLTATSFVGSGASLTNLPASSLSGTITGSTWNGTAISPTYGGTGLSNPTAHSVLVGEGASNVTPLVLGAGQLLIGTTNGDPATAALTQGTGMTITSNSGSITIANAGATSFNSRTGAISPASGDYTAAQVTNAADKTAANTFTEQTQTFRQNNITTTYTDAAVLANTTAATSGVAVQQSPNLIFQSHAWNTGGTPADNSFFGRETFVPASGNPPTAKFSWATNRNGAGYTERMSLTDGGVLTATSFVGSGASLTNLPASNISGTITGTTWNGTAISPTYGGTGLSNPTAHSVLVGEGASNVTPLVLGAGQLLIGTTNGDPATAALTQGTGMTITSNSGSITIANAGATSFNSRTGAISPASGDYTAAQVTNAADKTAANTFTEQTQTFRQNNITTTYTDAAVLANTTAATSGVAVQQSPNLIFQSHAWNTGGTPADNSFFGRETFVPASGNPPTAKFSWATNRNGAGYTERMSLTDGGVLTATSFVGSGASLTNLPASNISGTITGTTWNGTAISPTYGGTGLSNPTAHSVLVGEGSSNVTPLVLGAGQLLIGTTNGDPATATLTQGTGMTITSNSGSITIANAGATSFNSRTGAVSPASGDYTAAQVTNAADKTAANTFTEQTQTFRQNAIATTYTDAAVLSNTTAATAGVPVQQSPNLTLKSNVWNSTSSSSNTFDGRFTFVPATGATPSGKFSWATNNNGAGFAERMSLNDAGALSVASLALTTALPIASGGTNASSMTNTYGVVYYDGSKLVTSAQGASNTVLHGNAASAPTFSAVSLSADVSGQLPLANGGLNANLSASNGGIFYSTGSAGAILSGTATASQILLSGSSAAPTWSSATYPSATSINQLLYSSAANVIGGLATSNYGVLVTSSSGVPSISPTITLDGTAARTFSLARNTTAGTAGQGLTVKAGAPEATSGTNNLAGGDLTLSSGISEGTGTSKIVFQAAAAGASGNTDNAPATVATLTGAGVLTVGANNIAGTAKLSDGGATAHYASIAPATQAADRTYTIPDANGSAKVMLASAGGGVMQTGYNSSDATNSSNPIAYANANGLSFAIGANEVWAFDFELSTATTATNGTKYQVSFPSGATIEATTIGVIGTTKQYQSERLNATTGTSVVTAVSYNVNSIDAPMRITGVVANGGTAGTVQLGFENLNAGFTSTIYKYSYVIAHKL